VKKKLLSLFLGSALLLSISTEQKAINACNANSPWYPLILMSGYGVIIGAATCVVGGIKYLFIDPFVKYAVVDPFIESIFPNSRNTIEYIFKSQELINNINDTYEEILTINDVDNRELFLQQLAYAKNPGYSVNKYIADCSKNIKNLSWYQKKLNQYELKDKNITSNLCSDLKHVLAEVEHLKSKMELLCKTLTEHKDYFLLQEQINFMNGKMDASHTVSKNDVKKLQRLQAKVDLDEYPILQEKIKMIPVVV